MTPHHPLAIDCYKVPTVILVQNYYSSSSSSVNEPSTAQLKKTESRKKVRAQQPVESLHAECGQKAVAIILENTRGRKLHSSSSSTAAVNKIQFYGFPRYSMIHF